MKNRNNKILERLASTDDWEKRQKFEEEMYSQLDTIEWVTDTPLTQEQASQLEEFFGSTMVASYVGFRLTKIRDGYKFLCSRSLSGAELRSIQSVQNRVAGTKDKWNVLPKSHKSRADFALKRQLVQSLVSHLEKEAPEIVQGFAAYASRKREPLTNSAAQKQFSALSLLTQKWDLNIEQLLGDIEDSLVAPEVREQIASINNSESKTERVAVRRDCLRDFIALWQRDLKLPLQAYEGSLFFQFLELTLPWVGIYCESVTLETDLYAVTGKSTQKI